MEEFCLVKKLQQLLQEKGFMKPTEPQRMAIPRILAGKNVLLIAPTGTGKTEAALLPILENLLKGRGREKGKGISLLYITPLRALNRDLLERIRWWCMKLDLKVSVRHGDTEARERKKQSLSPPEILITTPETLQIILNGRVLRRALSKVRYVIVDEVHELAESKRGAQLSLSLQRLRWEGADFQLVGLSATVGTPEAVADFLFGELPREIIYVPVAKRMEIEISFPFPEMEDRELSSKIYTYPEVAARLRRMKELVEKKSSLIFTNTRPMAEILGSRFRLLDFFPVSVHHGSLSALSRIRAEQGLKSGKIRGVVCTSSLELGIDVGSVELCIQYNSPRQVTRLIQRVGRSGHWIGGTSEGVVVVQDGDDAIESLVIARRAMLEELEPVRIPLVPYDALMHEIAGLLLIRRRWRKDDAFRLVNSASLYRKLTREEFERILRYMQDLQLLRIFEDSFIRGSRRIFSYYYSNLSMIPETKQYLVINDEDELPVGILDEEFLLENDIGTKFIMAGSCWKILQIYKDKVWVVPEDDPEGAIPSWVGEEIPVPFEVAQEVGRIRVEVENGRAKELTKFYPAPEDVIRRSIRDTSAMPCIPTDDRIVVEKWDGYLILHASFGTLVNRTLSRYLSYRISETGEAVSSYHDAYRIYLRTDFEKEKLKNLLIPEKVEEIVKNSIVESKYFKRRFVQVARRMGAIEEEPSPSILDQLLLALRETPVWDEAFKEVVSKDLDLKKTVEILSKIKSGKIDLVIIEGEEPSPLARTGLRSARAESIPKRRRAFMISSVLARILSEVRTFICLKCRIAEEFIVKDAPLRCRKCGSHLGIAEESLEDVERLLDRKEKSFLSQMEKSASLLSKYGRNALLVLSSRVNNAEKILAQEKENDELIEMIIEEERKSLLRRWRG